MNVGAPPGAPPENGIHYQLGWFAGASAVIDLSMTADAAGQYLLRYASPFRPTMRPPAGQIPPRDADFRQLVGGLREVPALREMGVRGAPRARVAKPPPDPLTTLAEFGRALSSYVLPPYAMTELSQPDLFVEIGTDERLLDYPWELMHDGQDFLCLHHFVGRFVNLTRPLQSAGGQAYAPAAELGDLRVLIVSVPRPRPQNGKKFDELTAADAEIDAVKRTLADLGIVPTVLADGAATIGAVRRELLTNRYHVVHFTGHAVYDAEDPRSSSIVLDDGMVSAGVLTTMFANQKGAVLCFVNACETARSGRTKSKAPRTLDWNAQYDIFGLARPFLESGAYLLGSRWLLPDEPAAAFAEVFYRSLLGENLAIGQAITAARRELRVRFADDLSWASYVYYGDPRVWFKRLDQVAAQPAPQPARATAPELNLRALETLAGEYERIRADMKPGVQRTMRMTELMRDVARTVGLADTSEILSGFLGGSRGERIVALSILEATPNAAWFDEILGFIEDPMSPFEQYHSLLVAQAMVPDLKPGNLKRLAATLREKLKDERFFGTDRAVLAQQILGEVPTSGLATSSGDGPAEILPEDLLPAPAED